MRYSVPLMLDALLVLRRTSLTTKHPSAHGVRLGDNTHRQTQDERRDASWRPIDRKPSSRQHHSEVKQAIVFSCHTWRVTIFSSVAYPNYIRMRTIYSLILVVALMIACLGWVLFNDQILQCFSSACTSTQHQKTEQINDADHESEWCNECRNIRLHDYRYENLIELADWTMS